MANTSENALDVIPSFLYAVVAEFARLLETTSNLFCSFTMPVQAVYKPRTMLYPPFFVKMQSFRAKRANTA